MIAGGPTPAASWLSLSRRPHGSLSVSPMLPPSRPPVALLAAVALVLAIPAGAQCSQGAWEAPFDHEFNTAKTNQVTPPRTATWPSTFNAVHMSLIPVGPYRGQVLVWDKAEVQLEPWQRWSIIDPEWTPSSSGPLFRNHFLLLPSQDGDLFCAGHVWGQDGRLFVAGGTLQYPSGGSNYLGGLLVALGRTNWMYIGIEEAGPPGRGPDGPPAILRGAGREHRRVPARRPDEAHGR